MSYEFEVRGGLQLHAQVSRAMKDLHSLGGYEFTPSLASRGSRSTLSGWLTVEPGSHSFDDVVAALLAQSVRYTAVAEPTEPVEVTPVEVTPAPVHIDTSVINLSVRKLIAALRTGEYDDVLSELIAAERAGQNRKSAIQALEARAD